MRQKTAFVTGSARGIGRGIVLSLAEKGWNVGINYVASQDAAENTANECRKFGVKAEIVQADVGQLSSHQKALDQLHSALGPLDLLVNNAGVAPKQRVDLLEAEEESFDRLMRINLKGPYFLTQKYAKYCLETQKEVGDFTGMIINISSISAYTSSPARGDYCLSKAGMAMATSLFADRLSSEGIRVYEIRPGIIKTDMTKGVTDKYDKLISGGLTPIEKWGSPEDVGKAVLALAQGLFPFSTGEVINVDGGFHMHRL